MLLNAHHISNHALFPNHSGMLLTLLTKRSNVQIKQLLQAKQDTQERNVTANSYVGNLLSQMVEDTAQEITKAVKTLMIVMLDQLVSMVLVKLKLLKEEIAQIHGNVQIVKVAIKEFALITIL
jgi:hypothetical protein